MSTTQLTQNKRGTRNSNGKYRLPTCSDFGPDRRDMYPKYFFCSNYDNYDNDKNLKNINRNSKYYKFRAKHESWQPMKKISVYQPANHLSYTKKQRVSASEPYVLTNETYADDSFQSSAFNDAILAIRNQFKRKEALIKKKIEEQKLSLKKERMKYSLLLHSSIAEKQKLLYEVESLKAENNDMKGMIRYKERQVLKKEVIEEKLRRQIRNLKSKLEENKMTMEEFFPDPDTLVSNNIASFIATVINKFIKINF